ncbi:MAG TPA: PAS domain-containing sensor histidine kinase [Acidimicrobiia bacterium]|jgi:PAS domain S-box-containing protein
MESSSPTGGDRPRLTVVKDGSAPDPSPSLPADQWESAYRALADTTADIVTHNTADGIYVYVSPSSTAIVGWEPRELIGKSAYDFFHPDDLAAIVKGHTAALTTAEPQAISCRFRRKDGEYVWLESSGRPLRDFGTGEIVMMIAVSRLAGNPIEEAAKLRQIVKDRDRFVATVSHEMRTPLTAVVGFAEMLKDESVPMGSEERRQLIRAIAEEAFELTHIVEDLLVSARSENGTLVVAKVSVDLRAQVAQVLESVGARGESIKLEGDRPRALGDPSRARQIVRNLVSNAIRYGGPNVRVILRSAGPQVSLVVADDGVGLHPAEWERIFEPYYKADTAVEVPGSVGLGLTVSRQLARLMGGDLVYKFEDGESRFVLTMPRLD